MSPRSRPPLAPMSLVTCRPTISEVSRKFHWRPKLDFMEFFTRIELHKPTLPRPDLNFSTVTDELRRQDVNISIDDKCRCMDNIFFERLWRSLKYEEIYLHAYVSVAEAKARIGS
jgi:hypothetical protein